MTYGVYNRDLKSVSLRGQHSIDNCKKYLWYDTDVVCSEKEVLCAVSIRITFHAWRGFHYNRWERRINLGFVSIETHSDYYTWADKIVYDPQATKGASK